ncbi:MAG: protein translocase subunit SecF [Myxococcales bacterium]|nr:protein translocase subunit SecF [Myxococcales bacterium]
MPFEIIRPGTHIDFIGKRRIAFAISAVLLLSSIAAVGLRGVRLGIDFAGGTELQLRFQPEAGADEGRIREVAGACGVEDASVVRYGEPGSGEFLLRFSQVAASVDAITDCSLNEDQLARVAELDAVRGMDPTALDAAGVADRVLLALANRIGPAELMRLEYVGPRVGDELRRDGLSSIAIACLMILAYIAFRFSVRFAPGAVIALLHDVGITAGIFVMLGLEFDLRVLAALLAILGYSLNDTIIIYDRIRENMEIRTKRDLVEVLNLSVNQTLSRTVLTSATTLGAVLCLLIFGGEVIRPFAMAMAIGIVVGTYSSTFVAAPTLLLLETKLGGADAVRGAGQSGSSRGRHPKQREGSRAKI